MTAVEAINKISEFYVPGVIDYYARLDPDPWQKAFDDLHAAILAAPDHKGDFPPAHTFLGRLRELCERFKVEGSPGARFNPITDAWALGSIQAVDQARSAKEECCYRCDGKEMLRIERDPASNRVFVVCKRCRPKVKKRSKSH